MNQKRTTYLALVVLLCFTGVYLLWELGSLSLLDWDENIYAEAARQMLLRGDYLNVFINNHSFAEKPPFFFWEQVLAYKLFGVNEFAARFPSAIAGLLMTLLFFLLGKKTGNSQLGLIWGLVYLTCLLPSFLGRAAVIDHTFNLFIAAAVFFLYIYRIEYKEYCELSPEAQKSVSRFSHLKYLIAASLSMGVGTLTKGPLAIVIPLVSLAAHKFFYPRPKLRKLDICYSAFIVSLTACSWYIVNWIVHGESFLFGFIRFQSALFSKTLEGHSGPFYYHFVVALFGLIPWTPFLPFFKYKSLSEESPSFRPLFIIGAAWSLFVLTLMSLVSTKLPHYSASVYIPLTLFIAFNIQQHLKKKAAFSLPTVGCYLASGLLLAGLVILAPYLSENYSLQKGINIDYNWPSGIYYAGAALIVLFVAGSVFWRRKKFRMGLAVTAFAMLIFIQGIWRWHVPVLLEYTQNPLLRMVDEAHEKDGKVVFYRMVSFAALFYGKQPIEMLHTYKFPGNPEILSERHPQDLYIICDKRERRRLLKERPLVRYIKDQGNFSMFILPKIETGD